MKSRNVNPKDLADVLNMQPTQSDKDNIEFDTKSGNKILLQNNKIEVATPNGSSASVDSLTNTYAFWHNKVFVVEAIHGEIINELVIFEDGRFDFRSWNTKKQSDLRTYSSTYGQKKSSDDLIEKISKKRETQPFVKTVEEKQNSLQEKFVDLLRNLVNKYPNKPTLKDRKAEDNISLLHVLVGNFDRLMKYNVDMNTNFQINNYLRNNSAVNDLHKLKIEIISYLTWYEKTSYDQKDLLLAITEFENEGAVTIFDKINPKHFGVSFKMNVSEFADRAVAIDCLKRSYDSNNKIYTMIVEPSYGYKPEVKDKRFKLTFKNCEYVSEFGNSVKEDKEPESLGEFNNWGYLSKDSKKDLEQLLKEKDVKEIQNCDIYYFGSLGHVDIIVASNEAKADVV